MSKVLELKEKRAKAWEAAKAFLDSKQGSNGLMSAEDAATYDRMEAEVVDLGKEIDMPSPRVSWLRSVRR